MANFILNLAWVGLGLFLLGLMLASLCLVCWGVMLFLEFAKEWMDDMGWGNRNG